MGVQIKQIPSGCHRWLRLIHQSVRREPGSGESIQPILRLASFLILAKGHMPKAQQEDGRQSMFHVKKSISIPPWFPILPRHGVKIGIPERIPLMPHVQVDPFTERKIQTCADSALRLVAGRSHDFMTATSQPTCPWIGHTRIVRIPCHGLPVAHRAFKPEVNQPHTTWIEFHTQIQLAALLTEQRRRGPAKSIPPTALGRVHAMKPRRHPVTAFPGSFSFDLDLQCVESLKCRGSAVSESTNGTTSKVRRYTLFKAL